MYKVLIYKLIIKNNKANIQYLKNKNYGYISGPSYQVDQLVKNTLRKYFYVKW